MHGEEGDGRRDEEGTDETAVRGGDREEEGGINMLSAAVAVAVLSQQDGTILDCIDCIFGIWEEETMELEGEEEEEGKVMLSMKEGK